MSRELVVVLTLIMLSSCALAAITVQDLFNQGETNNANIQLLKQSFESFKTTISDQINLIKIEAIVGFGLLYIALNCFAYLFKAMWNYRNKEKLRQQRDRFVENLKKEITLQKEKNKLLEDEGILIRENFYLINEMLGVKLKEKQANKYSWLKYAGLFFLLAGIILVFYNHSKEGAFCVGVGLTNILISSLSYYTETKNMKVEHTPENMTVLSRLSTSLEEENASSTDNK